MKRITCIIIILCLVISCKKNTVTQNNTVENEEIYSDSFSPPDWESPISRKNISSGDRDIGNFIKKDVVDPKNRNILLLVEQFVTNIKSKNDKEIEKLMVQSAYHSFILRYPDISFKDNYIIRVEQPSDLSKNTMWIQFKVIFSDKSLIGKIELEFTEDKCKISDFDDDFFKGLKARNSK